MCDQQYLLLDWGDTLMRVFPKFEGPMKDWRHLEVFPHAIRWLGELKRHNWHISLATNASDSGEEDIRAALSRVGLGWIIDRIFCYENLKARKPEAIFFEKIIQELGANPAQMVMVGDDFDIDVMGANQAGLSAIWFNFRNSEVREGSHYRTIHHYKELLPVLSAMGYCV